MPRSGPVIASALLLGLAACGQRAGPVSGSAAPATGQPPSAAPAVPAPPASAAPPGFDGAPYAASRTYFKLQGRYPQAWFICNGVDQPRAFVVGLPDASRNLTLLTLDKSAPAKPMAQAALKLGEPDPGAGNVYWPLTRADGSDAGYLRAINPGMLETPASATTATFTSIKLGEDITSCRWTPDTVVEALGARRSYLVTREGGQLVYRTFDYAAPATPVESGGATRTTAPTLEIRGGSETQTPTGTLYAFDNLGYRYTVEVGGGARPHGAVMAVKDGRQVAAESFAAFTLAK